MRLADIPALPIGADQVAMAYRAFDHWLKHEHRCEHDSVLECIDDYARAPRAPTAGEGERR